MKNNQYCMCFQMKKFEKHVCPIEDPQMALKFQMISATHKNYRVALPFEMIPLNDDMFIAQHKQNNKITILHEQFLPQGKLTKLGTLTRKYL